MPLGRFILSSALVLATAIPAFAYTHARRGPTSHTTHHRTTATHAAHPSAPRVMDSERATEIQSALIKAGYLSGTPSGHWDAASEAAMQKLQGDNGWQTKLTPDSRALIKLGLGPKQDVAESTPSMAAPSAPQAPSNSAGAATAQP
jgi:Putative peptidoglycan binding domain